MRARPQSGLREIPLIVSSKTGRHQFIVELAITDEQEQHGLMFRSSLAPDRGMLFLYESPRSASFWMRNTFIPLDILFIRPDRAIAQIESAIPHCEVPISSRVPVLAVIELAGGSADKLGIREGDPVQWDN